MQEGAPDKGHAQVRAKAAGQNPSFKTTQCQNVHLNRAKQSSRLVQFGSVMMSRDGS